MKNDLYKNTFLIVYAAGAYGTFLDWCIHWFSGTIDEANLPFTSNGSAHHWRGYATSDITHELDKTIDYFLNLNDEPLTIRTHMMFKNAWRKNHEQQIKKIQEYKLNFRKLILVNNSPKYHLLLLHNTLTKIRSTNYESMISNIVREYKIKTDFGSTELIPRWQLREIISFWHTNWQHYLSGAYQPIVEPGIINISPDDLLHDFEDCLCNLFDQLELHMTRKDQLTKIKTQWLSLQKFKDLDQQLNTVVSAIVNNDELDFTNYTTNIFDEAFIQWKLREFHKLDLLCYNLDTFPTNTLELTKLLVPLADDC